MDFTEKKAQLKIYYFFMLADGECSADEMEKFSAICESMEVNEDEKKEIIDFCESAISISSNDNSAKVIREITKLIMEEERCFRPFGFISRNKRQQVEIVWTLINLGYADVEYSDAEKKVVTFLTDYWDVDSVTLADLNDTAETILALSKQKEWLKTTSKPYDVVAAAIVEIDKAVARMANNIQMLSLEANLT